MKKRVSVFCGAAFQIGLANFAGACENIILDSHDIATCLMNKAKVVEILADGSKVILDFTNYDTDNGKSDVTEESIPITNKSHYQINSLEKKATPKVIVEYRKEQPISVVKEEVSTTVEVNAVVEEPVIEKAGDSIKETDNTDHKQNNNSNENKFNKYKKSKA